MLIGLKIFFIRKMLTHD